jgi:hypothetical protein
VRWNRELRERMNRDYSEVRRVRRFVQPNGLPLFEVWTGVERYFGPFPLASH